VTEGYKICARCKEEKPVAAFSKERSRKDGLSYWCKACRKKHSEIHHDEVLTYSRKYYQEHREEHLARTRKYVQENKEFVRKIHQEYNRKHKKRVTHTHRVWTHRNKNRVFEYHKRRRIALLASEGNWSIAQFEELCQRLEWKCPYCGCSLSWRTVTVDHIVPVVKGGSNRIENINPSCWSCNASKGARDLEDWKREFRNTRK
jgi:hypothetical protein